MVDFCSIHSRQYFARGCGFCYSCGGSGDGKVDFICVLLTIGGIVLSVMLIYLALLNPVYAKGIESSICQRN